MGARVELPMYKEEPLPEREVQEACGVITIINFDGVSATELFETTRKALEKVQHRGQHGAGVAMQTEEGLWRHVGSGPVKEALSEIDIQEVHALSAPFIISGQTRYGTDGGYAKDGKNSLAATAQPCVALAPDGTQVVVDHNGQFVAKEKMLKTLDADFPPEASDTYIFTHFLAQAKGETWDEKVLATLDKIDGAFSMTIMVGETAYVTRDKQGLRPFVMGTIGENNIIVASETVATDSVGARDMREIKRGEVLKIDKTGVTTLREGEERKSAFCAVEPDYFMRPESKYFKEGQWRSVEEFRRECGRVLAREYPVSHADVVIGIPSSGIASGFGYAQELGLRYEQWIIKNPDFGVLRSFQQDHDVEGIATVVEDKLVVAGNADLQDMVVVTSDDSTFRAHVAAHNARKLYEAGAREIHAMTALNMVDKTCHLGVSLREEKDLTAYRNERDPEKIAAEIKELAGIPADYPYFINFISDEGFIQALHPEVPIIKPADGEDIYLANGMCGGCITGEYPVSSDGRVNEQIVFNREMVAA